MRNKMNGSETLTAVSMKSSVFWDLMLCRLAACLLLICCLDYSCRPKRYVPPKHPLAFTGIRGVICQKIELFKKNVNVRKE
jgi:hypothetical protein